MVKFEGQIKFHLIVIPQKVIQNCYQIFLNDSYLVIL